MDKTKSKILIIGGHFTAAYAVLEELKKRGYTSFSWIGHKYTMLRDKEPSAEYKEITKLGIPYYNLNTGKLYRHVSLLALVSLIRIPLGFIEAFLYLLVRRPNIVVSFGGYLAVPVALSAWLLRIPVITHEQTTTVGLSNTIIGKVSKAVLVAWSESAQYFEKEKVIVTGNPIRSEVFVKDRPFIDFQNDKKTILILGGNQGSHTINVTIEHMLPTLLQNHNIIHQTGTNTIFNDYKRLKEYEDRYPGYKVFSGIWGDDIGRAINFADIIITRAGANTVYEMAALKQKAILIPLPYAVHNEQYKNAQVLERMQLGVILEERDISADTLQIAIDQVHSLPYIDESVHLVPLDGAQKIADVIESMLGIA